MSRFETEGKHVNQATLQDCTDFHAAPEVWDRLTAITLLLEPVMHGLEGQTGMVIRHGQLGESFGRCLLDQCQRFKTAVTAEGMAMKIELTWTAVRPNRLQDRPQRMVISRHGTPLRRRLRSLQFCLQR